MQELPIPRSRLSIPNSCWLPAVDWPGNLGRPIRRRRAAQSPAENITKILGRAETRFVGHAFEFQIGGLEQSDRAIETQSSEFPCKRTSNVFLEQILKFSDRHGTYCCHTIERKWLHETLAQDSDRTVESFMPAVADGGALPHLNFPRANAHDSLRRWLAANDLVEELGC